MNRIMFLPRFMLISVVAMMAACAGTPKSDSGTEPVSNYKAKIREIVTDQVRVSMLVQLVDQAHAQC